MTALGADGRVVIVGAGLAGLRAAETLREQGFAGAITVVGAERYEPYDRPPLSKQVLTGWVPADHTTLPRLVPLDDVDWRLGVPAAHLHLAGKEVELADGTRIGFDRCLIATGVRARPWPNADEAALDGVFVVHGVDDAREVHERLAAGPRRVLVIGGGFTGSEIASVCRMIGVEVTLVERGATPLAAALGEVVGAVAAEMQRDAGVDLRTGVEVAALESDDAGKLRSARLSDGTTIEVDLAVAALGGIRNTDWLRDSGLAAGPLGVACDAGCRAADQNAIVTDDVFVAGDVARFPHILFARELIALEHWRNAVLQAQIAAHNMICEPTERRPHISVPAFWSIQFEVNIKSVGIPSFADEVVIAEGSTDDRRFVAAYGLSGRLVAAATFNYARHLEHYERQIAMSGPFPPDLRDVTIATGAEPVPAAFPAPGTVTGLPTVIVTGHEPTAMHVHRTFPDGVSA
jgi:NADPH-dependent 2,4-dienoyl-CoA reductase/sulfur reductase-like enzyme